jgi:hypothetical protein
MTSFRGILGKIAEISEFQLWPKIPLNRELEGKGVASQWGW